MVGGAVGPGTIGVVIAVYGVSRTPAVLLFVAASTLVVFLFAARLSRRRA